MRTLLLDSSFFPVRVISWQKAMILLFTGRAEVVTEYDNQQIRSVNNCYNLPKVLRLFVKHQASKRVHFTRHNVFWRDKFQCQYCLSKLPAQKLTLDHVIPASRGGQTSWENIVSSCASCNTKKGAKTPDEARMKLHKIPMEPDWSPQLILKLKENDPEEWMQWVGIARKAFA